MLIIVRQTHLVFESIKQKLSLHAPCAFALVGFCRRGRQEHSWSVPDYSHLSSSHNADRRNARGRSHRYYVLVEPVSSSASLSLASVTSEGGSRGSGEEEEEEAEEEEEEDEEAEEEEEDDDKEDCFRSSLSPWDGEATTGAEAAKAVRSSAASMYLCKKVCALSVSPLSINRPPRIFHTRSGTRVSAWMRRARGVGF